MKCKRNDTAVMIIDYQKKLMPAMANKEEIIARSRILLEGLKVLGIPMVMSEQYPRGLGETIPEIRETVGEDIRANAKTSFSVWDDENIREEIEKTGCKNILICGAETHICVLQSAIDMADAGKNVFIVEDCVTSRHERDREIGLKRAEREGIRLCTTESILFELTEKAGSDEFKAISKLIK